MKEEMKRLWAYMATILAVGSFMWSCRDDIPPVENEEDRPPVVYPVGGAFTVIEGDTIELDGRSLILEVPQDGGAVELPVYSNGIWTPYRLYGKGDLTASCPDYFKVEFLKEGEPVTWGKNSEVIPEKWRDGFLPDGVYLQHMVISGSVGSRGTVTVKSFNCTLRLGLTSSFDVELKSSK